MGTSGASVVLSVPCGTLSSSTMMVMMTAITPSLNASSLPLLIRGLSLAEAVRGVVVHHADRLHERVADGGADEPEAALQQILAHRLGVVEAPDIGVEAAEFLPHREERAGVRYR